MTSNYEYQITESGFVDEDAMVRVPLAECSPEFFDQLEQEFKGLPWQEVMEAAYLRGRVSGQQVGRRQGYCCAEVDVFAIGYRDGVLDACFDHPHRYEERLACRYTRPVDEISLQRHRREGYEHGFNKVRTEGYREGLEHFSIQRQAEENARGDSVDSVDPPEQEDRAS